ncbi:Probable RNA-directed DNA polymerase from transposon X-element [Eumeta japonica]|uniref:Probable RNA-directed DNA polymerase from transposon X-element n=1 Tax=Eumeta variegata TaxID=151549 RepID=A0A4C1ZLJ6_EUMVA|nr:Probable RNA-directed DNA polymerase from transposon X-element [Eumeta japonica]
MLSRPPHDIAHISRIEEEVLQNFPRTQRRSGSVSLSEVQTLVKLNTRKAPGLDGIHKPGKPRDLPSSYRPISLLSGLGKLFNSKTRLSDHLLGKGLIIDEQFGFLPSPFLSTASPPLSRQTDISHLGMITLTRQDVLSEQEFLKAPPSSAVPAYTNDVPRPSSSGVQLALFADDTAPFTEIGIEHPIPLLQRAIDELGQWFRKWRIEVNPTNQQPYNSSMDGDDIRVSRLRSRRPKALHRLQVIQNKFCRAATDAHWCVRNSILHRDLELPTISKYMKDASKRFFDIAGSHPNAFYARRLTINRRIPPTLSSGHRPTPLLHPAALTASGRRKEPTRDGFLRHPMPRRLPPGVVHSACHAPSALACAVRPHSVKLSKSSDLSSDSSRPTK